MKKKYFMAGMALILAGSLVTTSCIGSFAMTNKVLSWNRQVSSKFVNELIFFAFWIIPVYEITGLADLLVVNSIEFWSGSNPMAKGKKVIDGENGRYMVDCDGKGYTITSENDGSSVRLDFDEQEQTWSLNTGDEIYPLMTFVDDTHVALPAPDGSTMLVELSEQGVLAYSEVARTPMMLAAR